MLAEVDHDFFDLLDAPMCDDEFASNISSLASQPDYDNMAIDAYEEAVDYTDEHKSKPVKLHDYAKPESNWADDYNKGLPSKIKANNMVVIEEDVENEIDSDYSMTLKHNEHVISDIRKEIDLDDSVNLINTSRDNSESENPLDFDNYNLFNKSSRFEERRRSRKDRKLSIN